MGRDRAHGKQRNTLSVLFYCAIVRFVFRLPSSASRRVKADARLAHDPRHKPDTRIHSTYCLDMTPHALIRLSVYPANSVWPSALHAKLTHSGSRLFLPTAV